jgi:predicted DNA-binding transcriptional regulator AlpA
MVTNFTGTPQTLLQNALLTPKQVANRLQVSVAWVRDHSTRTYPRLPVVRVGGLLRYHSDDIDRWIQDLRSAGLRKAS